MRLTVWWIAAGWSLLPSPAVGQVPVGGEFRVNAVTTSNQIRPSIAVHPDSGFVVLWMHQRDPEGRGWDVVGRRFDSSGHPLEAVESPLHSYGTASRHNPDVTATPGGGFIATWLQDGAMLRRFDPSGSPLGPETSIHTSASTASVAADSQGDFVVVWKQPTFFPAPESVHARRYGDAGIVEGADIEVAQPAQNCCLGPLRLASDAAGNFVVVWSRFGPDGSGTGVFARRYDASGQARGPEFQVNTWTTGDQENASVAADGEGRFIVVWNSARPGAGWDVKGQRYDAAGAPEGAEFTVNSYTTVTTQDPRVALDANGGFLVAWTGWVPFVYPVVPTALFARGFDASGHPRATEFRVSQDTRGQSGPALASDGTGFVLTWTGGDDGHEAGVFAQRFGPEGIFSDGFESGTLAAWSSSQTDGGSLAVSADAGMAGTRAGAEGNVNDRTSLYVQDDSPRGEHRYHARFYFNPGDFDPGEAAGHFRARIFVGFEENPARRLFAVVLRRRDGQYALMARARLANDTLWNGGFAPIGPGPHFVELAWTRASAEGEPGSLQMWVDGAPAGSSTALANARGALDLVRLGTLGLKGGASGTMYWDEFESRRSPFPRAIARAG